MRDYRVLWLCVDCMYHHANGECGGCHEGHDEEPLNKTEHTNLSMGLVQEEHGCGREDGTYFGDCNCETNSFSMSSCDGCGSQLYGERHGFTEFVED